MAALPSLGEEGLSESTGMATRHHMNSTPPSPGWLPVVALACLAGSGGCTSVISSAYLRDAWLDAVEHASEPAPDAADEAGPTRAARGDRESDALGRDAVGPTDASVAEALAPATLDEAAAEADRRLARSGGLSDAARGALESTLRSTPRQDWPVVIEEFTAALAAAHLASPATSPATDAPPPTPPASQPEQPEQVPARDDPARDAVDPMPPLPPATPATAGPAAPSVPERVPPDLRVQNACFASRVRGWGVVDRFETARFQPGQEVIVYFELDQVGSRPSADGHTTRIDTALRILGDDGRRLHEWTFEPLEETCGSPRRDYFARYLVALPESLPAGPCRLELVVADTVAGRTARTTLPLEIAP